MSLEQIKNQAPVLVVIILATILIIGAIQVGPRSMDFNDRRVGMSGENKMGKPMEKWDDKPKGIIAVNGEGIACLLYTSPSPRDKRQSRMPSSA